MSSWVLAYHQIRVSPSNLREASWILVSTTMILFILQYTSIWRIKLSNFLAFTSPSYIGNSNLMSSFNKGVLPCPFGSFGGVYERVEEVEYEDDGGLLHRILSLSLYSPFLDPEGPPQWTPHALPSWRNSHYVPLHEKIISPLQDFPWNFSFAQFTRPALIAFVSPVPMYRD